uniref:DNA-directed RNA polymerase subunit alpha n=1 Tax=Aneura pinguis TaxID=39026 RepID=A0A221SCV7_ANEPI|nr:RNA polymerase alpha subunit [Aneura pinguis]ASN73828.1 RNA polymerase alpha subunit [Aneura pinguis]WGO59302.1 RNA polymerase alpha subunit [Aneura pinguis]WGO59388.1 RNA polymerase alpha subunit [Aneura pinguis]WGO59474.1 RNA polymerase alpha subunit [Aneura pinguis]
MIQEEIEISTRTLLRWRCIESRTESKRLLYGRFAISPFRKGQANTVGIAMRRALLDEIEGASITSATIRGVKHEYSAINGIRESIHDILINLKEIILRSDSPEPQKAYISVSGPSEVTARDIRGSSLIHVIDSTQYVATITGKISLDIELDIEKDRGYRMENSQKSQEGFFPIDAVFMPIRNANYSVHSFGSREKTKEILLLEIWTDGSLTPEKALYEASRNLIDLSIPSMNPGGEDKNSETKDKPESDLSHSTIQFVSMDMEQMTKDVALKHIFIDQLELPARAYNCLKRVNVHTVADLLDYGENDLMKIKNFGKESIKQVSEALKKRFFVNLPKNKNYLD